MGQVSLDNAINGYDGQSIREMVQEDGKQVEQDLTMRKALTQALIVTGSEQDKDPMDRFKQFQLANKIHDFGGEVMEFTSEQVTTLKEVTGKIYGTNALGAIWLILDPALNDQ